jgi:hypothetical protein
LTWFFKFWFFAITGSLIGSLVSGNPWPLICSITALIILVKLFGGSSGSGGGGAGSTKNRHRHCQRRCRRHRWLGPVDEDSASLFQLSPN